MSPDRLVSTEEFYSLITRRIRELTILAAHINQNGGALGDSSAGGHAVYCTRPLLADVLSEASKLEELLDAYGAKRNRQWYPLREATAALKLFSAASYTLQHTLQFLPTYRLLSAETDFAAATQRALELTCRILTSSARMLLKTAGKLAIPAPDPEGIPGPERFSDTLPRGHLPFDRESQKVASPEETVVYLATAFLNLAEDAKFIHATQGEAPGGFADWIPDPISEERLRDLEQEFHNLQSLYDTNISDSNVESLDERLPVLRGHITVIFHLLETATAFTHYCERHVLSFSPARRGRPKEIVESSKLLEVLFGYSLAFSSRFILATRALCHEMLKRYAIQGRVTVPVPRYRGFHVRPSTLIAKIVSHYGSQVTMELEGELYNAGVTLDLFRANEKINARKKRRLAEEVHALLPAAGAEGPAAGHGSPPGAARAAAQRVVHNMFAHNRLVLYERTLSLAELSPRVDETKEEFVTRALVQLLTVGKIDVTADLSVVFTGDRRVLEDIRLLAESGYGEDDFGNNLPLPERLRFLRK
jgi:hypothetical protein